MKTWITLFLVLFGAGACSHTEKKHADADASAPSFSDTSVPPNSHRYKYSDLVIKDYDEMSKQVQARIKNAHKATKDGEDSSGDTQAIEELRDALKLVFSRPNSDNMIAKLTPDVRRELSGFSAFEDTISSIVAEALGTVKDSNASVPQRSTSLFILENVLSEIRPEVGGNEDLHRVVQRIADAKIKIADDVIRDRKVRSMFKTKNPTEYALEILKSLPKKEAKDKK